MCKLTPPISDGHHCRTSTQLQLVWQNFSALSPFSHIMAMSVKKNNFILNLLILLVNLFFVCQKYSNYSKKITVRFEPKIHYSHMPRKVASEMLKKKAASQVMANKWRYPRGEIYIHSLTQLCRSTQMFC